MMMLRLIFLNYKKKFNLQILVTMNEIMHKKMN